jgi:hypothetical protein
MNSSVSQILGLAAAIIASLGSAGGILFALSSWLGRIWATRIMEREKAELTKSIEEKKSEFQRSIEYDKAELARLHDAYTIGLQELSTHRQDAMHRRRDVYGQLATALRVFLRSPEPELLRTLVPQFMESYDKAYLWASEPVALAIRDLVQVVQSKALFDARLRSTPNTVLGPAETAEFLKLNREAQERYQRCLLEMRKDCGFPETAAEYRLFSISV